MKTILLISPYWKESHRWMVSSVKLAELWQRLGYRVVVACMGTETGREVVSETLIIHRRKDFFLPDPWNYGIAPGFTGLVRRLLREERPDLVVVNKLLFWTSFAVLPLRLTGRRVLLLTDALVGMTWWPRGWLPRIGAALYAWTLGWLILLCAQRVIFFHPQPPALLRRLGIVRKSQVIPTGIDPAPYSPTPVPSPVTGEGGRGGGLLTVTYIGRLESIKGVEDFLAAAMTRLGENPSLKIQVVGWYKPEHPLVRRYQDRVSFPGLRSDIPAILAATDIFVLPSYSEGLSNALMEAMASGCACIASEVGGNVFLLQNGVSGFLFPAGDREALRAHIRRLLSDPAKRRALGEAARKRIEEVFSWEKVGRQYSALFEHSS
ncbi:MAG: glycosyltransferase family 4 protein [Candidatus Peribacteraceae bacterium]|nr:glycosyltransferase family 4 protein [Candidatus Peribacteraceae bacterium]